MDPLRFQFDAKGLASVRVPVLLLRAEDDSYLSSKANALALALAAMLPVPPQQIVSLAISSSSTLALPKWRMQPPYYATTRRTSVCKAIHRKLKSAISRFLHETCKVEKLIPSAVSQVFSIRRR